MESANQTNRQDVPVISPQPVARPRKRVVRWLSLALLVAIVGGASIFWVLKDGNQSAEAAPVATVSITPAGFEPQTIKIKKGQSVNWVNKDTAPHQLAADMDPKGGNGSQLNSHEPLTEGESYAATFEEVGTFNYHDQLNPVRLKATVIVE